MNVQLDPDWLDSYYTKLGREIQFSTGRRDSVTNWGLTLFLAIVAAYAASFSPTGSVPAWWRLAIVATGLSLSIRFFFQGMIAYSFLKRWRFIEGKIEDHWTTQQQQVSDVVNVIRTYAVGRRATIRMRDMLWSQLRAGFVLNLSVLFSLLIVEVFRTGLQTFETVVILIGFIVYLIWEIGIFLKYDQLRRA